MQSRARINEENEDSLNPHMVSSVFSYQTNENIFTTMEIVVRRYIKLNTDNRQVALKNSFKLLIHDLLSHVGRLSKLGKPTSWTWNRVA